MRIIIRDVEDNTDNLAATIHVFTDINVLRCDAINEVLSFITQHNILYRVYIDSELTKRTFGYHPTDIVSDPYFFKSHDDIYIAGDVRIVPDDYDEENDNKEYFDDFSDRPE